MAFPGFVLENAGLSADVVLTHIDTTPVPTMEEFVKKVQTLKDFDQVLVRFFHVADPHGLQQVRKCGFHFLSFCPVSSSISSYF